MRVPLWFHAICGLLAGGVLGALVPVHPPLDIAAFSARHAADIDPRTMSVRELRRLPGIGEKRARAVARARAAHDAAQGPLRWPDVSGIGERTEHGILEWLVARGGDPDLALVEALPVRVEDMQARQRSPRRALPGSRLGLLALISLQLAACALDEGSPLAAEIASAEIGVTSRLVEVGDARIRVRCAGPDSAVAADAVLLLHGARFTSQTWVELGTLEILARAGRRVVAVDLPGYGESEETTAAPVEFLLALLDTLAIERAVLVSPSMSGCTSLPFLVSHPERLAGFVPVAPACLDQVRGSVSVPTLVLWGENDSILPCARASQLVGLVHEVEIVILPDAQHACYLDQPERFHELLTHFVTRTLSG